MIRICLRAASALVVVTLLAFAPASAAPDVSGFRTVDAAAAERSAVTSLQIAIDRRRKELEYVIGSVETIALASAHGPVLITRQRLDAFVDRAKLVHRAVPDHFTAIVPQLALEERLPEVVTATVLEIGGAALDTKGLMDAIRAKGVMSDDDIRAAMAAVEAPSADLAAYAAALDARIAELESAPPPTAQMEYLYPRIDNWLVATCLSAGTDCGAPAADAYCKSQGYVSASEFREATTGQSRSQNDLVVCEGDGACKAFAKIICVK